MKETSAEFHTASGHALVEQAATKIQLLIADDRNRQLLASFIDEWTTPLVHETIQDADLFLIDQDSLPQYREALLAHKREQHPIFCPVLLLGHDKSDGGGEIVDIDDAGAPLLIDDSLPMPVKKHVLARRLRNLLARRTQTKLLRAKTDRLDQFASMVSHDLRNPLNVAQGRVELARENSDSKHLETATTALDRMETLIEDVLTLARQGQPISDVETVQLSAIAEQCWTVIETREADLTAETDCTFQADPDRLQRLVENLFRNAIDHGRDDVTIRVGALDEQTGFYVADDGPGIPESDREDVFEAGYSTADAGTGFGLAIVSGIVEAHGWTISVTESATGGARFEIIGVTVATE